MTDMLFKWMLCHFSYFSVKTFLMFSGVELLSFKVGVP